MIRRPTGSVGGLLVPPRNAERPDEVTVRFAAAGAGAARAAIPRSTVRCKPDRPGRFHCPVPAGRLDLRVRADGFISHFVWDREVEAGEELWLGTLELVRGASMVGLGGG